MKNKNKKLCRSEGFPKRIFGPCALWARGLASCENCRRAVVAVAVGVSWFHQGAIASRTSHPAYLARNKSWPKWSRSPSVPSSWSKWAGSPQVPILQYFQIHRSYQNAWSFSISRFTGHTRMSGLSVFPHSRVLRMLGPLMPKSISSDTQHKRYKFRHPKYKFRHPTQAI